MYVKYKLSMNFLLADILSALKAKYMKYIWRNEKEECLDRYKENFSYYWVLPFVDGNCRNILSKIDGYDSNFVFSFFLFKFTNLSPFQMKNKQRIKMRKSMPFWRNTSEPWCWPNLFFFFLWVVMMRMMMVMVLFMLLYWNGYKDGNRLGMMMASSSFFLQDTSQYTSDQELGHAIVSMMSFVSCICTAEKTPGY